MIPDAVVHLLLMAALVAYSRINKGNVQITLILCIYAAAWQVSEYLSYQDQVSLFFKLFFQTSISIALIHSVVRLEYTRFTSSFVWLLLFGILAFFIMIMIDKFASPATFNYAVDVFSLLNIQLIYLELLALTGVTFDMGNDKGIYRKSADDILLDSVNSFSFLGNTKESHNLAQK